MLPLAIAGGAMMAGGLAGSLFGKKKKASVDLTPYINATQKSSATQRDLIGQQFEQLQPLSQEYESKMSGLGTGIEQKYGDIAKQYRSGLSQVGGAEQAALESILSSRQQQTARNIPLQQQLIRENLAASGGFRTGGAAKAMQAPITEMQQQQADLASQLSSEKLAREAGRMEKGTEAEMQLAKEGTLQKLGIDENTLNTLLETGRTDIIDKLGALRGVESDELQSLLGIYGMQTNVNLANTAAENERRQALYNTLTGIGGSLMGMGSGPSSSRPSAQTLKFVRGY